MRIFVFAKTRAKKERIERLDAFHFRVAVTQIPEKGKANDAIKRVLARYFSIPVSQVALKSGASGKQKVFIVPD